MATKEQYEVFKLAYDEEFARYADLRNTSKVFVGVCSFFLGGVGFKANDLFSGQEWYVIAPVACALGSFLLSFMFLIRSLGVSTYEAMFQPRAVVERFGAEPASNEDFFDDRIADIVVSCERNWKENENRSRQIQLATYWMTAGILLASFGILALAV